jgi:hypothetical protein
MVAVSKKAKDKSKASKQAYAKTPKGRYSQQKAHAKARSIEFKLSFEEWWGLWDKSGKYPLMGKSCNHYCMTRGEDSGAYELGNVSIQKVRANLRGQLVSGAHKFIKLTQQDITEIKTKYEQGATQVSLAKEYGISVSHVWRIIHEKRCKVLQGGK